MLLLQEYGSTEGGRFFAAKHTSSDERGQEMFNRLARSEGSLQMNEKSCQLAFTKNPRYNRRFKGKKTHNKQFFKLF